MANETTTPPSLAVLDEVEASLKALESSLASAGSAVGALRSSLAKVTALTRAVGDIEAVLANARRGMAPPAAPTSEAYEDASGAVPTLEETSEAGTTEARPDSYRLLLELTMRTGTLDLKTVDAAVNEHDSVVDVALLDYDGSRASLQVWIESSADPDVVKEGLLESLTRRFAEAGGVEVRIDLEARPAA